MRKRKKLARQERERSREQFDRMLAGELYQVEGPVFSENFAHAMLYQQLFNETHDTDTENQRKSLENLLGEMGDGVMIRRLVIGGITIGDNTVVGAGSVVTRDLPANVIAVGNPAKILRELPPDVAVEDVAPGHLL